ncbi:MAG: hypothetical protein QM662_14795 [Gordonia sp. (in: high G+C Gram-positive bacteria)]
MIVGTGGHRPADRDQPGEHRQYGEFDFWLALVKVVAIVAFITVGLRAIFGLIGLRNQRHRRCA